jgi:uncharacterized protein YwgA
LANKIIIIIKAGRQNMWTRIAQTNLKRKNLNVDAAEVKYSNNIEGEVEEIILLRAAETNVIGAIGTCERLTARYCL